MRQECGGNKMSMAQVILGRHGSTSFNEGEEKIRAFIDLALSEKGQREAVELASNISTYPVSMVYCSPLLRARQTARIVAKACGAPMALAKELLPWNCGPTIQGQPVKDVLPFIKHFAAHPEEVPEGGETFKAFTDRFLGFLKETIERSATKTKDTCLIAHSRNLRLAKAWEVAGRPDDLSYNVNEMNDYSKEVGTGGVLVLNVNVRK